VKIYTGIGARTTPKEVLTITPSNFVICYTPHGKDIGGTSQAIRIAKHHHIPVYNLGNDDVLQAFENDVCP